MDLWVLVYSPITNEVVYDLLFFNSFEDLDKYVSSNKSSFYLRTYKKVHFDLTLKGVK